MENRIDFDSLRALSRPIGKLPPTAPAGLMYRRIRDEGVFEELGIRFTADDYPFGLYYAGLSVLARDMHRYLAENPRDDATLFAELVASVFAEESQRYGKGAFPQYVDLPVADLPTGLAALAAAGRPDIAPLTNRGIVHEWTFKPGKRLFLKFCAKFEETICGPDGPYVQFNNGLVGQAALPTSIAGAVLTAGFSVATFWHPLAVYFGVLLIKTGLKTYCEPG